MACKLTITGNLVADPELVYANNGTAIGKFTLASNYKNKVNGNWEDKTEYTNCICFSGKAEALGKHMKKGCKLYVEGIKVTDEYEKDGQKKYFTKCECSDIEFLTWPEKSGQNQGQGGYNKGYEPPNNGVQNEDPIPF